MPGSPWGSNPVVFAAVPVLPAARPQHHFLHLPGKSIHGAQAPWSITVVHQTWGVMRCGKSKGQLPSSGCQQPCGPFCSELGGPAQEVPEPLGVLWMLPHTWEAQAA